MAFCAINVLIDVESLYNLLNHHSRIHTFFHTYVGATLAAIATVLVFMPLRWLACKLHRWPVLSWRVLSVSSVLVGALLGAWTHVILDSIMHADITPLAPFSQSNALYRIISLRSLHLACLIAGGAALIWWMLRYKGTLKLMNTRHRR